MPRNRNPIRVKVKDKTVTLTFNSESWEPEYTDLVEFLGRQVAGFYNDPVDGCVKRAFELLGIEHFGSKEEVDEFLRRHRFLNEPIEPPLDQNLQEPE